jgi:hypothetical protein
MQEPMTIFIAVIGFVSALAITAGVINLIRVPLTQFLNHLLGDETIAMFGVTLVILLMVIKGLSAAFGFITNDSFRLLLSRLISLLGNLAGVIEWVAYIAALLFIGYSIRRQTDMKAE